MPLKRNSRGEMGVEAGGGGGNVEVNVINNTNAEARTQETETQSGGKRIDVIIDETVANNLRDPGSRTHKAMTQVTNAKTTGTSR